VTLTTDGCRGDVKFIEHVEALVTMSASVRGQVHVDDRGDNDAWWHFRIIFVLQRW